MDELTQFVKFFVGLLAIVHPVGAIPLFITLTATQTAKERHHTALVTAAVVAIILIISFLIGEAILHFFGISIAAFRVAGGILVLLIAISMMYARTSPAKQSEQEEQDAAGKGSVAVVPLAMPVLAGPGAISTVILYAHRISTPLHYVIVLVDIVLLSGIVWLAFRMAPFITSRLGPTGINIVTRIMGLLMAAIGVEFIATGLKSLLPGLA